MTHDAVILPIRNWLVEESLGYGDITKMFEKLCQQLVGVGLPISRARLLYTTLHPLFEAETVLWDEGKPATLEQFEHQDQETETWSRSPLKHIIDEDLDVFRRQLTGPNELLDYPILEELKEQGFTDYLILATSLVDLGAQRRAHRNSRGILVTWSSKRHSGFSDDDLKTLQQIQGRFAVAAKTIIQSRISRNITTTYLGERAGASVLDGQIRLGDGQQTKAVVWYSDMRNSTSHAETMEPDLYFSMLNDYFRATAAPVMNEGGEILDFIGDGVLGIFPFKQDRQLKSAAEAANRALDQTIALGKEINADRLSSGQQQFSFGVGINTGEVMFGNIGIPQRLSFSVIGPTVNEVARIEQMTKLLQHPVVAGKAFAELNPDRWKSGGKHKLDGVLEPVELFKFQAVA